MSAADPDPGSGAFLTPESRTTGSVMLAAPTLFGMPMTFDSTTGVSGKGNKINTRRRQDKKTKRNPC